MPDLGQIPLWDTQRQAIETTRRYLASDQHEAAALIQMPTGTGKSGVIATLATCFDDTPHVLVVSPFAALRDQISKDIRERFWQKLGVEPTVKPVKTFLPSTVARVLGRTEGACVYVCTIQTLQAIHSVPEHHESFNILRQRVSVVLFDEGHREPAQTWSTAVQALAKPTVLFTATPYRNDHKFLRTSPTFSFLLSHSQALNARYIRQIRFHEETFTPSATDFVEKLLRFYDENFLPALPEAATPRVIIRCESRESVMAVYEALRAHNREALAIHDEFATDAEREVYQAVPSPEHNPSVFWVHQNKLIEGIDDPAFRLLAIYEPLRNARSLVQQVGRILRNPTREPNQYAYVFCHPNDSQKAYWEDYVAYDRYPGDSLSIMHLIEQAQAGYQYFEGNFRKNFRIMDDEAYKRLSYRMSANVYRLRDSFRFNELQTQIVTEWYDNDRTDVNIMTPQDGTIVCVYCSFRNSPILARDMFLEFELGYTFAHIAGDFLFYYDSNGATPEYLRKHTFRISPVKLQRLFPPTTTTITNVSLLNSDLGRYSIRRRSLDAPDLLSTAPSLADQAQVCSTAAGSVDTRDRRVRRYLGFSRGRISDRANETNSFMEYLTWINALETELVQPGPGPGHRLFRRFSAIIDPPADPSPLNILLDLDGARDLFHTPTGEQLDIPNLCVDVRDNRFSVEANGREYEVHIAYDSDKRIYDLACEDLELAYRYNRRDGRQKNETVISYLRRHQAFRVVPRSSGCVYSHGHFYATRMQANELDLSSILRSTGDLRNVTEKGMVGSAGPTGWDRNSIFGIIDRLGDGTDLAGPMQGISHLVCDDLIDEVADFIALDEAANRVIFIHAKTGDAVGLSASGLADVCSQAMKNLDYLQPTPSDEPGNIIRWDGPWTRKHNVDSVPVRIRKGILGGREFWNKALAMLRNPDCSREVWIVMGHGLSEGRFNEEKLKENPEPEFIQAYYQLVATWSSVTAVGAKLTVFCSP